MVIQNFITHRIYEILSKLLVPSVGQSCPKTAQAVAGQTLPEAGQFLAAVEHTRPETGQGLVSVSFGLIETQKLAVFRFQFRLFRIETSFEGHPRLNCQKIVV